MQSTINARLVALAKCVKKFSWIRETLTESACPIGKVVKIYKESMGTVGRTSDSQGLRKTKHIGIRYHYVRDAVQACTVQVFATPSAGNKADRLTKVMTRITL